MHKKQQEDTRPCLSATRFLCKITQTVNLEIKMHKFLHEKYLKNKFSKSYKYRLDVLVVFGGVLLFDWFYMHVKFDFTEICKDRTKGDYFDGDPNPVASP